MRLPLRRTLAPVQLGYGDGAPSQGLLGRRFMLDVEGGDFTLSLDLTPNFHTRDKAAEASRPLQIQGQPGLLLSLEPVERAWLHERIAQRFDAMLDAGLVEEVRRLRARGDLGPELPSMRCVGYRQAWAALEAAPRPDRAALVALREAGIAATRQLAKRQLTWLRSMPDRTVVACDGDDPAAAVVACVRRWIGA